MTQLRTAVCDILGCKLPIILAGMGGPARAELVSAVSEAGGYGFLGMVRESPRRIAREIAAVRALTALPFGVNLIPAATDASLLEAEVQACIDAKIASVTLFWDMSPDIVLDLLRAGILVVCQIGSSEEADAALHAGAHILVAQGCETGGHVRGRLPLRDLLPQILALSDRPVLAAGGMTDGADLAWAIASGAAGVMMGTAFLATEERRRITLFSTDSPLRTISGDLEAMALYAGEGSSRIRQVVKAGDLVRIVAAQAQALLAPPASSVAREPASPVCYAGDATAAYNGMAEPSEIVAALEELLQAERAGARVAGQTALELGQGDAGTLLREVQRDEARWCAMLMDAMRRLDASPSRAVGAFYGKAMAINDADSRLAFLNKGQDWVVRRLESLIPLIPDSWLREQLGAMRRAHVDNIRLTGELLAARGRDSG